MEASTLHFSTLDHIPHLIPPQPKPGPLPHMHHLPQSQQGHEGRKVPLKGDLAPEPAQFHVILLPGRVAAPVVPVEAVMGGAGSRYQALIGDDLVPEGATVRGYRVKRIQADSVEFEKDGRVWVQKVQ